jgi:hypothetical protein
LDYKRGVLTVTSVDDRPTFSHSLAEAFALDLRSLAALRVAMALLIILDLIRRSRDLVAHYTDAGVLPRPALIHDYSRWFISFHSANGTWEFQALLFVFAAVFAAALILGYRTRFVTVVSWLMLASLHSRNPLLLDGGDVLLRVMLFWAIFLPWGACWSIDSAFTQDKSSNQQHRRVCTVATFVYVVQIVFVYWFSVLHKDRSEWIQDANALYYVLNFEQFLTPVGNHIHLKTTLSTWLTQGVLWFEVIGPLLLFSPVWTARLRIIGISAFSLMHLSIGIFMNIGIFTWVAPLSLLGLVPTEVWDKLAARLRTKERLGLKIFYDKDCSFCFRAVRLLKTFFLIPETIVAPAQTDPSNFDAIRAANSWIVVDERGNRHSRFAAVVIVATYSPLLWPLAGVLRWEPVKHAGEWSYPAFVRCLRRISCSHSSSRTSQTEAELKQGFLVNSLLALLLVYVLVWNIAFLPKSWVKLSERQRAIGEILRIDQIWNMFATVPKHNSWYVVAGTLKNGEVVDLLRDGAGVSWGHPPSVAALFPTYRWWKYFFTLSNQRDGRSWALYTSYICRAWPRPRYPSETLESVRVVLLAEEILPDNGRGALKKYLVSEQSCVDKN